MFKRVTNIALVLLFAAWELFFQPIWNINVERWAEERSLDEGINQVSPTIGGIPMPSWLTGVLEYFFGGFLQGMASLAAVYLLYDLYVLLVGKKRKSNQLKQSSDAISAVIGSMAIAMQQLRGMSGRGQPEDIIGPDVMGKYYGLHAKMKRLGVALPDPYFVSIPDNTGKKAKYLFAFLELLRGIAQSGLLDDARREARGFSSRLYGEFDHPDSTQALQEEGSTKPPAR